ncbi:hypothetical protein FOL47_006193 [Perkinsus chesapeaki]|uniref:Phospholipid/glycerol acyltransferase domain-containing protein n=1 Tax=Perkinsus chesapeaki TaxID=330153 RepID=A0A7J6LTN2_PERCH|nr:hypothetical protein FOL47_006193 [Perkinsus chesapeaki]
MPNESRLRVLITASSELLGRILLHTLAREQPESVIYLLVESGAQDYFIIDSDLTNKSPSTPHSPEIRKVYMDAGPLPNDINAVVYCGVGSSPEQAAKFFDRCSAQLPDLKVFVYASSVYSNWGVRNQFTSGNVTETFSLAPTSDRPRASSIAGILIGSTRRRWPSKNIYLSYCCEQALARRWLQVERPCQLAFVRFGLLTPPACSTFSRAFNAVAERVAIPGARVRAGAGGLRESRHDVLMTASVLPNLDGRRTDPKAVLLITPADLAARAILSAALDALHRNGEVSDAPQVYALALASPMLQWGKLRKLIIDRSGGRVSAADGHHGGAVLHRTSLSFDVCSPNLEIIAPSLCADAKGIHVHNYVIHCLGILKNVGEECLDAHMPAGRSLMMQQPLRYTDILSDTKWQHGGVVNFALRKEALSYHMPDMEKVRSLVLNSKAVREATHSKKLKAEAAAMLDRIMGNQRSDIIRVFVIVLHKVFTSIYDRVLVNHDGLDKLKELNQRGAKVLLLPTHRSYIDFLVLSYICYYADIRLPFIATGDNFLSIVGIWKILQHSGAFFMKRSFNSETHPLYSIVFKTYMQVVLEEQGCVEMFIEGARSRSGTTIRPPKVGLLRFAAEPAVQAAMSSPISDITDQDEVYLVPISIGYSRVMEVDSLATELEGRAKVAESLARTVSALRYLSMNFGTLTVHIDPQPIKVSDAVKRWKDGQTNALPKRPRYTTPYQQLAEEVADRLDANMPIHTTHLVAAILLWKRHDSVPTVSHAVMVDKVRWLSSLLKRRGLTIILDDTNTSSAVSRVASLYVDHVIISAPEEETGEVSLGHEASIILAAGDAQKLSFLREELLQECIPASTDESAVECNSDPQLRDFAVSLIGPVVECWWVVTLIASGCRGAVTTTAAELVSGASGLAKELYEEGKCVYLEACSFDFAKKAVRGMTKRGCLVMNGRNIKVDVDKTRELLALLESIRQSPALPQGRALSDSSEVLCSVEERQPPTQRRFFTQLRGMTLIRPLGRSHGTSKM